MLSKHSMKPTWVGLLWTHMLGYHYQNINKSLLAHHEHRIQHGHVYAHPQNGFPMFSCRDIAQTTSFRCVFEYAVFG